MQSFSQQFKSLLNTGKLKQAHTLALQLIEANPSDPFGYFYMAELPLLAGNLKKALELNSVAQKLSSVSELAFVVQEIKCLALLNNRARVLAKVASLSLEQIDNANLLDTIGVSLSLLGEHQLALPFYQKAVALANNANMLCNYASTLNYLSFTEQAIEAYEKAIASDKFCVKAHLALASISVITEQSNHIMRLNQLLPELNSINDRLHIAHALSRELEAVGKYKKAFSCLEQVKQQKSEQVNYDSAYQASIFNELKHIFSDRDFALTNNQYNNQQAIFVSGMPRSGTTLVERVLTNSTGVKSAGELQDFGLSLKRLSKTRSRFILDSETLEQSQIIDYAKLGEAYIECVKPMLKHEQRFVDKTPLNVLYAGHIIKALPKVKMLCVIRNPMDTVWGNYKQMFSLNDPYYQYAFDQCDIAEFYLQFVQLAEYWQTLYPDNFKIVKYDDFVQKPEQVGQEFVEFCGIDWSPSLLDITKNDSAVATASSVQVRSAINTKSLGQWRNYQQELQPAFNIISKAGLEIS